MNSSTEELLDAFESLPVEQVIILPNNPNIILAAEQASKLSSKEVAIIPTRSIPQGIAAMLAFDPDGPFDKICDAMYINSQEVRTGEITTATHSTTWNNYKISKGEIIGLQDSELICVADTPSECSQQLLRTMINDDCELITFVSHQIAAVLQTKLVNQAIAKSHQELEFRVNEKTKELRQTNLHLQMQIDERKKIEQQLYHDAHHDSLTSLPNRSLFLTQLEKTLQHYQRFPEHHFAVLFIDLDKFKDINESNQWCA